MLINKNKNKFLQISVLAWLVILLAGCGALVIPTPEMPTSTPVAVCGEGPVTESEYSTYSLEQFEEVVTPGYTLVLLDRADGSSEEMVQTISFMRNEIVSHLSPGDRLVMAWIEPENTTQVSIFLDERVGQVYASIDMFPPKPQSPLIQPTPTRGGSTTQKNLQQLEADKIEAENEESKAEYHCKIGRWNADSKLIYDEWEQQRSDNLNIISEKIRTELVNSTANTNNPARDIYGSLDIASSLVQPLQNSFSEYTLLLLSNMEDIGNTSPENINLQNFDTLIVVAEECGLNHLCDIRDTWTSKLQILGIIPTFLSSVEVSSLPSINPECDPNGIGVVSFQPNSTEYVMVLIDKTRGHEPYLPEAIQLITDTIASHMETGDHLLVSWLDLSASTHESMFVNERVPNVPTPSHAELNPNMDRCEEMAAKVKLQEQYDKWKRDQQIHVDETAEIVIDRMGTLEPSNGKLIYESLKLMSRASLLSQEEGEGFKRYTLFVFSNNLSIHTSRTYDHPAIAAMDIDLNGVNVYIIDLSCDNHLNCADRNKYWVEEIGHFYPTPTPAPIMTPASPIHPTTPITIEVVIPITEDHIANFLLHYMTERHND